MKSQCLQRQGEQREHPLNPVPVRRYSYSYCPEQGRRMIREDAGMHYDARFHASRGRGHGPKTWWLQALVVAALMMKVDLSPLQGLVGSGVQLPTLGALPSRGASI
ncbi:hypothetical protein MKX07_001368 [Trichoderma sp. CBMAI-0711]|nr:hypothetical protein MKX07_001368 [Trichoderma sp. CBMAI-0711]